MSPLGSRVHWHDRERERRALVEGSGGPGVARVLEHECLAVSGSFCSACVERCPRPGAMRVEQGRPIVDDGACDGCGVCANVCPAPGGAIVVFRAAPHR